MTKITKLDEFHLWLNKHNAKFSTEGYSVEDIVRLALACGFNSKVIHEWKAKQPAGD